MLTIITTSRLILAACLWLLVVSPVAAEARLEVEQILTLKPNVATGKSRFAGCIHCHGSEGWGAYSGAYPQIAGQHASVIIKQLLDIHAGRRENPEMLAAARELADQGAQALADVAAYIASLKMNPDPGVGEADDAALEGAAETYQQVCSTCHGAEGEGNAGQLVPLLQGQNYEYLLRQLKRIQAGKRKNANTKMRELIRRMPEEQLELLAAYIARLQPAESRLGPYNWINPDFQK